MINGNGLMIKWNSIMIDCKPIMINCCLIMISCASLMNKWCAIMMDGNGLMMNSVVVMINGGAKTGRIIGSDSYRTFGTSGTLISLVAKTTDNQRRPTLKKTTGSLTGEPVADRSRTN